MRRRYSAEQWAVWIDEQAVSGRTIAGFCESLGVSVNSFYVWRRKLRAAGRATRTGEAEPAGGFIELAIGQTASTGASTSPRQVEIEFPCGALMRVPNDELLIRSVLGVLLEAGAAQGGASC